MTTETEPPSEAAPSEEPPSEAPGDLDDGPEEQVPPPRLVLGSRPPDSVSWRIHGQLEPETALQTGAAISCSTTFAGRRAEAAELDRKTPTPPAQEHGVLGGPMPARDRSGARARVSVEVEPAPRPVMPSAAGGRRRGRGGPKK